MSIAGAVLGPYSNTGSNMLADAPAPDNRIIIERVPGGFILIENWGDKKTVCSTVPKLVKAIREKCTGK